MKEFNLDPEIVAFIEKYLDVSNLSTASSVTQQRIDYDAVVRHFYYPRPSGLNSRDDAVEGRHGMIPLRHYRYQQGNGNTLIMFIHGGGFILGSLDSHDDICAELCANTGYDLVSIDYRLSPEHFHPTHLDDVEDAFNACGHEHTILVGASAGGTLAAVAVESPYRLHNPDAVYAQSADWTPEEAVGFIKLLGQSTTLAGKVRGRAG